jgi:hypothetical protein
VRPPSRQSPDICTSLALKFADVLGRDHPLQVFDWLKGPLVAHDLFADVRVAYREAAKDEYTILWPGSLRSFTVP